MFIFLFGALFRLYNISNIPGGINQDEAFAGYNAYSLLHYGIDSAGYHNPVYLIAWGSGMNALESYLMIPFIALFGLKAWVIRLPQAILACVSIPVFYLLLKRLFNRNTAFIGMTLLAICPWHIMLSRWGLESNLAPAFLLFGFYFFIRGLQDSSKWFCLAAVFYGLSLYSYATLWTVLPILLLLQGIYCLKYKTIYLKDKNIWIAILILGLMALPLLLFVMVNSDIIGEIRTHFISIPKLTYFRSGDISFDNIPTNLRNTYTLITSQNDGNIYNVVPNFGIYYLFSNIFVIIGFAILVIKMVQSYKKKEFSLTTLVVIEIIMSFTIGLLASVNVNRINALWLWLLLCIPVAINGITDLIWKNFNKICILLYSICFIAFCTYYFGGQFNEQIKDGFSYNLEETLQDAVAKTNGDIHLESSIHFPVVLFYSQMPVDEFLETVVYRDSSAAFLDPVSYGQFTEYDFDISTLGNGMYILYSFHEQDVVNAGYNVSRYGRYIIAERK